ncbi:hypothetical protein [Brumimicrobium oceani]|uniref:Uncharacterized protein n=1 Tax=Brumimicrobium oceani TaxID=2100725 RepID=A0A2U2X0I7_9FLAO|nr:hypothetical protein [Brumimicrobium oceani]PWH81292.1 hypothetical protein DIT68_15680 [Brumimicrobium oceani]
MENEKLYRLLDVLDEIKQIDELMLIHDSKKEKATTLIMDQYRFRREQLLTYLINEINASSDNLSSRLSMIKLIMERFHIEIKGEEKQQDIDDINLNSLAQAIMA